MAGIMNEFAEFNEGYGYLIECVQPLPGLFTAVVPWLDGAQHKELTRKYRYRADWVFIVKDRGAGSVSLDENGQSTFWYPFDDDLDRCHFRQAAETCIRMHEAAGAEQIFLAGQPFAPWKRGDDIEAFIAQVHQLPIGPGGTPVFSAHQMCSAKLGSDPQTSVAKPNGELHDVAGVWIADDAELLRGQPDGDDDGARKPHGDEHARGPVKRYSRIATVTSAMTPS